MHTLGATSLATLTQAVITDNVYTNDAANWRFGRLTQSSVSTQRGAETKSRVSNFGYDLASSAKTGLLLSERAQADVAVNQDLRTLYTLDAFGNRVAEISCSSDLDDASCRNLSLVQQRPVPCRTLARGEIDADPIGNPPIQAPIPSPEKASPATKWLTAWA